MPENTEAFDIIQTAQDAVALTKITDDLYLTQNGATIDLRDELEARSVRPTRKTGVVTVTTVPSFAGYLAKHAEDDMTELWGNRDKSSIKAVINAHSVNNNDGADELGLAGWGDHQAVLQLRHTDDWRDWTGRDGVLLTKDQFADFVEDHLPNFPDGASFLELARSFRATVNVEFGNAEHTGGRTTVNYTKTTEAKAGQKGAVAFPDTITIGVYVYDGGKAYKLDARLRYKVTDGDLRIGYKLQRPNDVLQAAFDEVVSEVEKATGRTVWRT